MVHAVWAAVARRSAGIHCTRQQAGGLHVTGRVKESGEGIVCSGVRVSAKLHAMCQCVGWLHGVLQGIRCIGEE